LSFLERIADSRDGGLASLDAKLTAAFAILVTVF